MTVFCLCNILQRTLQNSFSELVWKFQRIKRMLIEDYNLCLNVFFTYREITCMYFILPSSFQDINGSEGCRCTLVEFLLNVCRRFFSRWAFPQSQKITSELIKCFIMFFREGRLKWDYIKHILMLYFVMTCPRLSNKCQ